MKSSTLIAKLDELVVTPSRGRPRVSNDNPYSEALFKTLKYRPDWPADGFEDLNAARKWLRNLLIGITIIIYTARYDLLVRHSATKTRMHRF